ncbi:MAG: sulfite exporter TauE/SafE family protein [Candidatus Omnitrophica bacterium]|nr:sulfite exporter TauE/SafE family protein [Candidatus Omnitrophota bacterium]
MDGVTLLKYVAIMILGFINGAIGILVGGISIITIPALIVIGLPPHIAIATNRLGIIGLVAAGFYEFNRQKLINYKIGMIIGLMALSGSVVGAYLMLGIDATVLKKIIAIFSMALLILLLKDPQRGMHNGGSIIRKRHYVVGSFLSFGLGVYGGFYGAGVATFLGYLLVFFFGETFVHSAGTRTIPMLLFSVASAAIFIQHGIVNYVYAGLLFVSMGAGAYCAARHIKVMGNKWLKRMFIGIGAIMVIMLLWR